MQKDKDIKTYLDQLKEDKDNLDKLINHISFNTDLSFSQAYEINSFINQQKMLLQIKINNITNWQSSQNKGE